MKIIKISLYLCAILAQFFLFNTKALANSNIYTNNAEQTFQYFLIYDANGGDNAPAFQQSTSNIFYISNEIPTRENYTFAGWASTENAALPEYQPGYIFLATENLTILYAVWQSNLPQPTQTFTLLYDANEGEQAPAEQTKQTTEIFCPFQISFDEPVRAGYIFLGWSTSQTATSAEFMAGDEFWAVTPLTTLYAVWQEDNPQPIEHRYILIYDANGGALAPESQIEYDFDFFHVFTLSATKPVRLGWDFLGWHTDANALLPELQPNDIFVARQEKNVLYAIWQQQEQPPEAELIEYTLFYNANGGFNTPNEQKATGTEANCLFVISGTTPQMPGYNFLGWALEAEATQPICQPGGSLITTEKQTTLYAVWQKLPDEPPYEYLKELLGAEAVRLKCANEAAGHLLFSYPLKENSYSFQLNQTGNKNFTASLLIKPAAYLDDYNANISGHKLLANASSKEQLLTLFYDEEKAAWLTDPDYNITTFIVNCQAPAQPAYTELAQILGTILPIRLECIDAAKTEHYPIGLNLEPNGLQIGPSLPYSDNAYSCLLTFQAQPYIERYNITYGPHQLVSGAESEQTVQLYFNTSTQSWQSENAPLPCFKLICAEPTQPQPVYQYQLSFNANGGGNEPYPQMAAAESESYAFFIPQDEPTRRGYLFIGWAVQAEANQPAYQPGQLIFLHKEAPKLTLYAVWQPNGEITPDPDEPTPPEQPQETAFCLYYDSNGGLQTPAEQICYSTATEYQFEITAEQPKRNGYTFTGWALISTADEADYQPGDKLTLSRQQPSLTLYAVWQEGNPENPPADRPGSGGSGGRYQAPTEPQPEEPPQLPTPQQVPHQSYINGYADGTIRPNSYLSRAEAAVMLYRLLNPDAPETTNETNWYDDAVNFLKQAELLQGYQDGSLQAQAYLTRAELATLAVRVHNLQTTDFSRHLTNSIANAFPDITEHWAAEAINQAAALGWLHGYPDGTFRPNQAVSRAEAVTLLNLLFNRASCAEQLMEQPNLPNWPDNPPEAWYYTNMLEAGHSHTYTINADTNIILSQS